MLPAFSKTLADSETEDIVVIESHSLQNGATLDTKNNTFGSPPQMILDKYFLYLT